MLLTEERAGEQGTAYRLVTVVTSGLQVRGLCRLPSLFEAAMSLQEEAFGDVMARRGIRPSAVAPDYGRVRPSPCQRWIVMNFVRLLQF